MQWRGRLPFPGPSPAPSSTTCRFAPSPYIADRGRPLDRRLSQENIADDTSAEKRRVARETGSYADATSSLERESSRMRDMLRRLKKKKLTPGSTPQHLP